MDLNEFMNAGAQDILETARRFYLRDAKGTLFIGKMALSMARAMRKRDSWEKRGTHVPPFLIASIASECNLDCVGCYARATASIGGDARASELTDAQWRGIFREADDLGVSFILLAGGEPTLRRAVIEDAAQVGSIFFAVFTNGTLLDDDYMRLFDEHRNLVPVFSIEGDFEQTDARRGAGIAARVRECMELCTQKRILWGVSITVTTENMGQVTDDEFVRDLRDRGCGLVIYNEYVPIAPGTGKLALGMTRHNELMARMAQLTSKDEYSDMSMIAFPGNEEYMGGCLAAGRGFFHISQSGAAEPCPFSPFSVMNVGESGLLAALRSPFFAQVREIEAAHADEHMGGCTLFKYRSDVERLVEQAEEA